MSAIEISKIIHMLESSREEVIAAARSVPEAQASAKPAPGRWSALDCVEHIAAVETRLLGRLASAERLAESRVDPEKEAKLAAMVADRSARANAPEPVRPNGRFTSVEQALDHFTMVRSRTVQFAEERGADLYLLAGQHPRFGALNGAEMIVFIAAHGRRHAEQIREIADAAPAE
jgi:uncharacterized damage-inducible protein DinB